MKWIIEKDQEGMLVRDYLMSVRAFSRSLIRAVKMRGSILLNGGLVTVRERVGAGDELVIQFPPEKRGPHLEPVQKPVDILYEDEDVLVLNKPAHLATIPSVHHLGDSLANRLMAYYDQKGIASTAHILTRLDRDTSGIVLVAKNRFIHMRLSSESDKIRRRYMALVEGRLSQKQGTFEDPIGRKAGSIIEREVASDGKEAITHYRVMTEQEDHSLVSVILETGRTHQIRVHFSYIGHPLMGDTLYGRGSERIDRQALHCSSMSFLHPSSGEWVEVEAELPDDMKRVMG